MGICSSTTDVSPRDKNKGGGTHTAEQMSMVGLGANDASRNTLSAVSCEAVLFEVLWLKTLLAKQESLHVSKNQQLKSVLFETTRQRDTRCLRSAYILTYLLPLCLSIHPSISIHPFMHLSIYLSIYLYFPSLSLPMQTHRPI